MGNELSNEELQQVARRAYEHFEARGRAHGRHLEDWLSAEVEVPGRARGDSAEDRCFGRAGRVRGAERIARTINAPHAANERTTIANVDESSDASFPASDPPS